MNKEPLSRFLQTLKQFVLKEKVTGSKKGQGGLKRDYDNQLSTQMSQGS